MTLLTGERARDRADIEVLPSAPELPEPAGRFRPPSARVVIAVVTDNRDDADLRHRLKAVPRLSLTRENDLWQAAEQCQSALRREGIRGRRQAGSTQETERDEQWVVTIPERLSEAAYDTLATFVAFAAECMGVDEPT